MKKTFWSKLNASEMCGIIIQFVNESLVLEMIKSSSCHDKCVTLLTFVFPEKHVFLLYSIRTNYRIKLAADILHRLENLKQM